MNPDSRLSTTADQLHHQVQARFSRRVQGHGDALQSRWSRDYGRRCHQPCAQSLLRWELSLTFGSAADMSGLDTASVGFAGSVSLFETLSNIFYH